MSSVMAGMVPATALFAPSDVDPTPLEMDTIVDSSLGSMFAPASGVKLCTCSVALCSAASSDIVGS